MLTEKDRDIYIAQWEYKQKHKKAPTIRQLAEAYGTKSHSHIPDSLGRLVEAGLVNKAELAREGIYSPTKPPDEIDWEEFIDGKEEPGADRRGRD